jgi:hypothetical protein
MLGSMRPLEPFASSIAPEVASTGTIPSIIRNRAQSIESVDGTAQFVLFHQSKPSWDAVTPEINQDRILAKYRD